MIKYVKLKAQLPNSERPAAIGKPGERIYGTRALDDKVYVVTFLTTDPLYVIDVSDSTDPFIAGELEVPGFLDYLHPVSNGRLLGIGESASTTSEGDAGWGGWYQGLRLSLFDLADPSEPTLINALEFGDRGTNSDLFRDFHALAWLDQADGSSEFAVNESGLSEISSALLSNGTRYDDNARTVLSSYGNAWFYDRGELYYAEADSPTGLLPSQ